MDFMIHASFRENEIMGKETFDRLVDLLVEFDHGLFTMHCDEIHGHFAERLGTKNVLHSSFRLENVSAVDLKARYDVEERGGSPVKVYPLETTPNQNPNTYLNYIVAKGGGVDIRPRNNFVALYDPQKGLYESVRDLGILTMVIPRGFSTVLGEERLY